MHEIDIPERKKRLYMPQHLGECDNDQFAHMAFLFFQYQNKQITYEQMRYNAVYKLLNLEVGQNTKLNSLERGTINTNIYQLSILVDPFFNIWKMIRYSFAKSLGAILWSTSPS